MFLEDASELSCRTPLPIFSAMLFHGSYMRSELTKLMCDILKLDPPSSSAAAAVLEMPLSQVDCSLTDAEVRTASNWLVQHYSDSRYIGTAEMYGQSAAEKEKAEDAYCTDPSVNVRPEDAPLIEPQGFGAFPAIGDVTMANPWTEMTDRPPSATRHIDEAGDRAQLAAMRLAGDPVAQHFEDCCLLPQEATSVRDWNEARSKKKTGEGTPGGLQKFTHQGGRDGWFRDGTRRRRDRPDRYSLHVL